MNSVLLADMAAEPWRNGGGRTRELLAWPAGSRWQARVSVAEIASDGAFSAYPGVDRWFAVLEGAGVRLVLPSGAQRIDSSSDPLHFAGEAAPDCTLIDGPTLDLNLMLQRGCGRGTMRRARPGSTLDVPTRWRGLYAATATTLTVNGQAHATPAGALLWSDDADEPAWQLAPTPARAWWLLLEPQ